MRLFLLIGGVLVGLMGAVWALQGAWLLPATFMRGPEWIAIGSMVAAVGAVLVLIALRQSPEEPRPSTPSP